MSKQIVIRTVAAVALAHAASEVARSQGVVLRAPVRTVSWRRTVQPAIAAGQPWRRAEIAASAGTTGTAGELSAAIDAAATREPSPAPTPTAVGALASRPAPVMVRLSARSIVAQVEDRAPVETVPDHPVPSAPVGALLIPGLGDTGGSGRRDRGWRTRRLVAGAVVPVAAAGLLVAGFTRPGDQLDNRTAAVSTGVASSFSDEPSLVDPLARPAVSTPAWTTTTLPPTTIPVTATTSTVAAPAPAPAPAPVVMAGRPTGYDEVLHCIRQIESTQNYAAVSPSGKYRGAYQFDQPTWDGNAPAEWVGHDPATVPPAGQDQAAITLIQRRGLQPWPTPNRRCGHLVPN